MLDWAYLYLSTNSKGWLMDFTEKSSSSIWATSWEKLFIPYANNKDILGIRTVWSASLLFAAYIV